jgi:2-epi-5-epi-valiolone synthase
MSEFRQRRNLGRVEEMPLSQFGAGAWKVAVTSSVQYEVRRIDDVLSRTFEVSSAGSELDVLGRVPGCGERRFIVLDENVDAIYRSAIDDFLLRNGVTDYQVAITRGGERAKTMRSVLGICARLDEFGITRAGLPVIAFVGGVGSDVVGTALSLYRRGISRIEYPSTLVAAVDASIAFKNAVDFNGRKNRLGTYRPPNLVVVDRRFFASLPRRRLSDGLAEIVKLAVATDRGLFELLAAHGRTVLDEAFQGKTPAGEAAAQEVLDTAIKGMLAELAPNPYEHDPARPTYLGHTWSPMIEMAALRASRDCRWWRRRRWLYHGEAVALDMLLSSGLARDADLMSQEDYERLVATIDALDLPTWDPLLENVDLLRAGLSESCQHRGGRQLVPLPLGIGKTMFDNQVTVERLRKAIIRLKEATARSNKLPSIAPANGPALNCKAPDYCN